MKKAMLFMFLVMGAIHSQAQVAINDLRQGDGSGFNSSTPITQIIIQQDLKTIAQDEEISAINVLYNSPDGECRIESLASEIKKDQVFRLGYIYNSSSSPRTTVDLISRDGSIEASIECLERHDEDGISFYNEVLGAALLMKN
jgi:hypothetical protein